MSKTNTVNSRIRRQRIIAMLGVMFLVSASLAIMFRTAQYSKSGGAEKFFTLPMLWQSLAVTAVAMTLFITVLLYATYIKGELLQNNKFLYIFVFSVLITFGAAIGFGELINYFVAPVALVSILVALLIDKQVGIVTNVLVSQIVFIMYLIVFGAEAAIGIAGMLVAGVVSAHFLIVYFVGSPSRLKFVIGGLAVAVITAPLPMLINILSGVRDVGTILYSGLWSLVSTVLSVALFMLALPISEFLFRVHTPFYLAELCSLDNKLLKELSDKAPGTYNHSVMVADLTELCAVAIGENAQLAKVCAYYHDVGKLKAPEFFVENQTGGYNPHDELIPEVSVSMIVSHVLEGKRRIDEAQLPEIIADVAVQHHGTTPVNYFYYKTQNITEDDVDLSQFSYPGPKPQTKIAAIVMIADTVEAATRAEGVSSNPEVFRQFIHKLIKAKMDLEQFSDCPITFGDLKKIEDKLVFAIPSIYHGRIQYSKEKKK